MVFSLLHKRLVLLFGIIGCSLFFSLSLQAATSAELPQDPQKEKLSKKHDDLEELFDFLLKYPFPIVKKLSQEQKSHNNQKKKTYFAQEEVLNKYNQGKPLDEDFVTTLLNNKQQVFRLLKDTKLKKKSLLHRLLAELDLDYCLLLKSYNAKANSLFEMILYREYDSNANLEILIKDLVSCSEELKREHMIEVIVQQWFATLLSTMQQKKNSYIKQNFYVFEAFHKKFEDFTLLHLEWIKEVRTLLEKEAYAPYREDFLGWNRFYITTNTEIFRSIVYVDVINDLLHQLRVIQHNGLEEKFKKIKNMSDQKKKLTYEIYLVTKKIERLDKEILNLIADNQDESAKDLEREAKKTNKESLEEEYKKVKLEFEKINKGKASEVFSRIDKIFQIYGTEKINSFVFSDDNYKPITKKDSKIDEYLKKLIDQANETKSKDEKGEEIKGKTEMITVLYEPQDSNKMELLEDKKKVKKFVLDAMENFIPKPFIICQYQFLDQLIIDDTLDIWPYLPNKVNSLSLFKVALRSLKKKQLIEELEKKFPSFKAKEQIILFHKSKDKSLIKEFNKWVDLIIKDFSLENLKILGIEENKLPDWLFDENVKNPDLFKKIFQRHLKATLQAEENVLDLNLPDEEGNNFLMRMFLKGGTTNLEGLLSVLTNPIDQEKKIAEQLIIHKSKKGENLLFLTSQPHIDENIFQKVLKIYLQVEEDIKMKTKKGSNIIDVLQSDPKDKNLRERQLKKVKILAEELKSKEQGDSNKLFMELINEAQNVKNKNSDVKKFIDQCVEASIRVLFFELRTKELSKEEIVSLYKASNLPYDEKQQSPTPLFAISICKNKDLLGLLTCTRILMPVTDQMTVQVFLEKLEKKENPKIPFPEASQKKIFLSIEENLNHPLTKFIDQEYPTLLHAALRHNSTDLLQYLIKNEDQNLKKTILGCANAHPLYPYAGQHSNLKTFKLLLSYKEFLEKGWQVEIIQGNIVHALWKRVLRECSGEIREALESLLENSINDINSLMKVINGNQKALFDKFKKLRNKESVKMLTYLQQKHEELGLPPCIMGLPKTSFLNIKRKSPVYRLDQLEKAAISPETLLSLLGINLISEELSSLSKIIEALINCPTKIENAQTFLQEVAGIDTLNTKNIAFALLLNEDIFINLGNRTKYIESGPVWADQKDWEYCGKKVIRRIVDELGFHQNLFTLCTTYKDHPALKEGRQLLSTNKNFWSVTQVFSELVGHSSQDMYAPAENGKYFFQEYPEYYKDLEKIDKPFIEKVTSDIDQKFFAQKWQPYIGRGNHSSWEESGVQALFGKEDLIQKLIKKKTLIVEEKDDQLHFRESFLRGIIGWELSQLQLELLWKYIDNKMITQIPDVTIENMCTSAVEGINYKHLSWLLEKWEDQRDKSPPYNFRKLVNNIIKRNRMLFSIRKDQIKMIDKLMKGNKFIYKHENNDDITEQRLDDERSAAGVASGQELRNRIPSPLRTFLEPLLYCIFGFAVLVAMRAIQLSSQKFIHYLQAKLVEKKKTPSKKKEFKGRQRGEKKENRNQE